MKINGIIIIIILLCSCTEDWTEHERFMNESDCFVYNKEVISESLNDYTVEYIDTSEASGCAKMQLSNTYLLVVSKDHYISVSPEHPEKNLPLIESFIKKFKNSDSRLSSFSRHKNEISLTLSKKHNDPKDKTFHNNYLEWKYVFLTKHHNVWEIDSTKMSTLWPRTE